MTKKNYQQLSESERHAIASELQPNEPQWQYQLARRLEQQRKFADAANAYRQAMALEPSNAEFAYRLGQALENDGQHVEAAQAYGQAVPLAPANTKLLYRWGLMLEHIGQHVEAGHAYAKAMELEPTTTKFLYRWGLMLERGGQRVEAGYAYARAMELEPTTTKFLYRWGLMLEHHEQYAEAAQAYARAMELEPTNTKFLYRWGLMLERGGQHVEAGHAYARAMELAPTNTKFLYHWGVTLERGGQYAEAVHAFGRGLALEPQKAIWLYRMGKALSSEGRASEAEEALRQAMALEPTNAKCVHGLAQVIRRQGRTWQEVEILQQALELDAGNAQWWFELGNAQDKMNRFAEAAQAFEKANRLKPGDAMWHFREGYACERAGQPTQACAAYAAARLADKVLQADALGIGVFHQQRGSWPQAAQAYGHEAKAQPLNAQLQYCLGFAHDRCYRWELAETCYRQALAMEPQRPDWHYRLGFVLERQNQWQQAAKAYEHATTIQVTHTPDWFYRWGYVLAQAGRYEEACTAFLHTYTQAEFDDQQPNMEFAAQTQGIAPYRDDQVVAFYKLGNQAEHLRMWQEAAKAYKDATDRSENHNGLLYYKLGYVLRMQGKYEEACMAFKQTRILQHPHGVSEEPMEKNEALRTTTSYIEYTKTLPVRNDVILYESFNGNALSCNPFAIFKEVIEHPGYASYLHIWVLNELNRVPKKYLKLPHVVFLRKGSDGYLRYLATAKYLINNSGFPPYFVRRPEQKYLATWHGTPLKTLGKEQKYKFYDHKRTQRNFLQATHIISPNKHTSDILLDSYDIRPLYHGVFAETGYPRIDLTLNVGEEDKTYIRQRMGLTTDRPVVLYAPTWRGTLDDVAFDVERLEGDLLALSKLDCQILFRGHSLLETVLGSNDVPGQVVPADIDSNELLSIVDVLITDYSSIFFDFLATGRPVLYYIYDIEAYEQERGLYFSMEEMPGMKCKTIGELCLGVAAAIHGERADAVHYQASQALYNCHDDGNATRRVIDLFFEDSEENILNFKEKFKPSIVINVGSFQANGITSSAINLINRIDRNAFDVVLVFAPGSVENSPESLMNFNRLPSDIYVVPRFGNMPMSLEERWVRRCQDSGALLPGKEVSHILETAYAREFCRILGWKKYDSVVYFSGYDAFWTSVFFVNDLPMRKLVYLHNDMYSEYVLKFHELARMFDNYRYADKLVSVSEQTNQLNKKNLAGWQGVDAGKFVHCDNIINLDEIVALSLHDFECAEDKLLFSEGNKVFINIGRFSLEKDQRKLIIAFSEIAKKYAEAKLLILGDGPLRFDLEALIEEMQLIGRVHILGYRKNPYNYLKAADCFVLSSNHEGQPMTLLESLILEKPIVATDIVGNRSVMHDRGGLLVENSIQGLKDGMEKFIEGTVTVIPFDGYSYNKAALGQFYQLLIH